MSNSAKDGSKPLSSFSSASSMKGGCKAPTNSSNIPTSNSYDLLSQEFDPENYTRRGGDPNQDDMESEEEVEVVFDETTNLLSSSIIQGLATRLLMFSRLDLSTFLPCWRSISSFIFCIM